MILVDTGVVIAYLRTGDPKLLALFASQSAAICGVTRAEVLHGVRNPADHSRFVAALNAFHQVTIDDAAWDDIGTHLVTLRAAGLPVPLADVIIAAVAIRQNLELWSRDQHHLAMQSVIPALKLFQEPP